MNIILEGLCRVILSGFLLALAGCGSNNDSSDSESEDLFVAGSYYSQDPQTDVVSVTTFRQDGTYVKRSGKLGYHSNFTEEEGNWSIAEEHLTIDNESGELQKEEGLYLWVVSGLPLYFKPIIPAENIYEDISYIAHSYITLIEGHVTLQDVTFSISDCSGESYCDTYEGDYYFNNDGSISFEIDDNCWYYIESRDEWVCSEYGTSTHYVLDYGDVPGEYVVLQFTDDLIIRGITFPDGGEAEPVVSEIEKAEFFMMRMIAPPDTLE